MRRLVRYDNMLILDNTRNFKKCMCAVNARKVFLCFVFFFTSALSGSKLEQRSCKEGYPCVAIGEILVLIDCLG